MKPYTAPEIKIISLNTEEILSQSTTPPMVFRRGIHLPEDSFLK